MTIAARGCLFLTIHRRDYNPEELTVLHEHQRSFAREQGVPFPLLTILDVTERHIARFSKQSREATLDFACQMAPVVRCSGVVFDRGGFAASAIRSIITAVNSVSTQPFPTHVSGNLGAAIAWIESQLDKQRPSDFEGAAIAQWVRTLRDITAKPTD
jgi:hypothetical protein